MDVGIFLPLQKAAVAALSLLASYGEKLRGIYRERRDIFCDGLRKIGWNVEKPKGAFYVWCPLPEGSVRFALVKETNILKQIASRIGDAL